MLSIKKSGKLLLIILLVFLFALVWWHTTKATQTSEEKTNSFLETYLSAPTLTSFFLQEITIPALRSRSYASKINELEKYQDKPNYTSYLTSYYSDGLKINGLLTIPKSEQDAVQVKKHPAVVFVHGYIAPTIYKTTEKYVSYVDYLARNGFVVFKIDLRGHGNSEGEPGGAYYSSDYVIDVLNAYSALQNFELVDPEKIGLWGHSMAGNVTFRALVARQSIPALVIWAGAGYTYKDLSDYRINDQSYRPPSINTERARKRQEMRDAYGEFDPAHWFWKQLPATNYLEGVTGSLQLHHAENDNVVSIEYSRNLVEVLNGTNIAHELYEYPTGGHNIDGSSFNSAMSRTVSFFQEKL